MFISKDEDPDQALDESQFKHVWDVLKALRAHDEALGEELDELRRRLGARRSPPRRPGRIKLDVPAGRVGVRFIRAFNTRQVEQTTASWGFWYGRLQRFVEREGHSQVPSQHRDAEGFRLGGWVSEQRMKRGQLSEERRQRLEALPGWAWEPFETRWQEGYARLVRFVERKDHSRVPVAYQDDDGYLLGKWVDAQRQFQKQGQLSEERRQRLEALPGWAWGTQEVRWEQGYARLVRFVEREGHSRLSANYRDEDGYRLGIWVAKRRHERRRGRLSEARRRRLEAVPNWEWDPRPSADWEEAYDRLVRYAEREGHARVPALQRDDKGFRLGGWVERQRQARNRGRLPEERVRRLEAVPGWAWRVSKESG